MEGVRWIEADRAALQAPCTACAAAGCPWDRLAGRALCPDCQERLALGEGPPLVAKVEKRLCMACAQAGTLRFQTFPLQSNRVLEIDLCGTHVHALLQRRLDRAAYRQLSHQLASLGVAMREVFLLHEAFYDEFGHPLQPVCGPS
jgi:hypothetical protein